MNIQKYPCTKGAISPSYILLLFPFLVLTNNIQLQCSPVTSTLITISCCFLFCFEILILKCHFHPSPDWSPYRADRAIHPLLHTKAHRCSRLAKKHDIGLMCNAGRHRFMAQFCSYDSDITQVFGLSHWFSLGERRGYTLIKSPVQHRPTKRQTTIHIHTYGQLRLSN